jgi:hypothetical protein
MFCLPLPVALTSDEFVKRLSRTKRVRMAGSVCRQAANDGKVAAELKRVLGRGDSSSRIIRRISSQAACLNRFLSNGVVPVSNS